MHYAILYDQVDYRDGCARWSSNSLRDGDMSRRMGLCTSCRRRTVPALTCFRDETSVNHAASENKKHPWRGNTNYLASLSKEIQSNAISMEDRGCSLWHGRIVHVSWTVVTLDSVDLYFSKPEGLQQDLRRKRPALQRQGQSSCTATRAFYWLWRYGWKVTERPLSRVLISRPEISVSLDSFKKHRACILFGTNPYVKQASCLFAVTWHRFLLRRYLKSWYQCGAGA